MAMAIAFAPPLYGCVFHGTPANEVASAADDAPLFRACSLEQMQSRKTLSREADITGVATPFLIHLAAPVGSERLVRNGELISFSSNGEASAQGTSWLLETLDPAGRPAADAMPLSDRTMIRLRTAGVALQSDTDPPLVIVKGDVPDQNRPATCDAQIRDGDFVFMHTLSPSVWMSAAPVTGMPVTGMPVTSTAATAMPPAAGTSVNGSEDPSCVQDHETCVTDKTGGLVCAWAPSCAK